jgi:hypothetical protein
MDNDRPVARVFLGSSMVLVIGATLEAAKETLAVTPGGGQMLNTAAVASSGLVIAVAVLSTAWVISASESAHRLRPPAPVALCTPATSMQIRLHESEHQVIAIRAVGTSEFEFLVADPTGSLSWHQLDAGAGTTMLATTNRN